MWVAILMISMMMIILIRAESPSAHSPAEFSHSIVSLQPMPALLVDQPLVSDPALTLR